MEALLAAMVFAGLFSSCCPSAGGLKSSAIFVTGKHGTKLGQFHQPRAIAIDANSGRFYVVDRSGRIQLFDAILPSKGTGGENTGRPLLQWNLPASELGQPVGLCVESEGTLLVNDSHYHRILRYSQDGSRLLAMWGSEGTGPGQFTFGRDVVVDSKGFIYAGDYGGLNDRIEKFSRDGEFLLEWGGVGEEPGKLRRPQGMAIEARGNEELLLVADSANHRVQRFTLDGRHVSSFGKLGQGPGELRFPYSVAVGGDGAIYVCEWGNNRVQRFDAQDRPQGTWGTAGHGEAELATPWDIAVGPQGQIFVADYGNHRVQAFEWPAPSMASSPAVETPGVR